jgi:hypothetical protein
MTVCQEKVDAIQEKIRGHGEGHSRKRSAGKAIQEIGADVDTAMNGRKEAMETRMEASIKSG